MRLFRLYYSNSFVIQYFTLGAFCEKRLLASLCLSVCLPALSFACNNSATSRCIHKEFYIWVFLQNMSRKFKFNWNLKKLLFNFKNNTYFWSYLTQVFLEWEIFQTKLVEKIQTNFIFHNFFLLFYPLWDDVEKYRWQYDVWALHAGYLQIKPLRI
jgi:hypothetical protein